MMRSTNRQLSSNQERSEYAVRTLHERESDLHSQVAGRDTEIGRALARIDALETAVEVARREAASERESKSLVCEELRLLRQSLAMQENDKLRRMVRRCPPPRSCQRPSLTACARDVPCGLLVWWGSWLRRRRSAATCATSSRE
jgi:hypothetical protein